MMLGVKRMLNVKYLPGVDHQTPGVGYMRDELTLLHHTPTCCCHTPAD